MKTSFIKILLVLLPCVLYSQGYKKYYKPPGYNFRAPIGLIHNKIDPSCFFLRGQPGSITVEIASIDTNGNENIIHLIKHDSLKAIVGITEGANHACDGHFDREQTFVSQIFKPLEINVYSYNTISQKLSTYRFTPPIELVNLRVFNIVKVVDGYLVTGDWVLPGEFPRGYILAINKDFSLRYWKWYSTPYPDMEIYGAIEKDSFYLLYGYILSPAGYSWVYYHVSKENGNIIEQNVIYYPHSYRIYEQENSNFVGISWIFNQDVNSTSPAWVLMDENFNVLKQTEFGIRFYQMQNIGGKFEYPYHSARDKDGNYIVATQQFLPFDLFLNPQGPFTEVLCLTKISSDGDVLWETRDSVVYYPNINEWTVGNITGVSTGPEGEIYVLGSVNDIDTTINQYKTVGYIFKYDKHGCRIENCRSSSTTKKEFNPSFTLFPNPFFDQIILNCEEQAFLSIFDLSGKVVLNQEIQPGDTQVQTLSWPSGMYIVNLRTKRGQIKSYKVLKL